MSGRPKKRHRRAIAVSYVALGISVLTAAGIIYVLIGLSGSDGWAATFGSEPPFIQDYSGALFYVLPFTAIAGIILDVVALTRGGFNLLVGVVAFLILIGPLIYVLLVVAGALFVPATQPVNIHP
jgi:hypothetical protein